MNLYRISQTVNDAYDTYDSAVVCAMSPDDAKTIHPRETAPDEWWLNYDSCRDWAKLEDIDVRFIGLADPKTGRGIICASFNAG